MASRINKTKRELPVPLQAQKSENQRVARTRRQRGYHWEDTLVKRFNSLDGWKAFRLGSPSVGLPDILAVSTSANTIYTIEAKSGTSTTLHVPFDQIQRCLKWIHTFELYGTRKMVVAFKFLSKKRIGKGQYEPRELREYYKIWDEAHPVTDFVCTYDGQTYSLIEGKRKPLKLEDCFMPFPTRSPAFQNTGSV
ncbi:MAG TPA: resolvase [Candidatus Nitrosotalea sp.]|nr:resolvase [Candidatus Nitrosotalea sp.]